MFFSPKKVKMAKKTMLVLAGMAPGPVFFEWQSATQHFARTAHTSLSARSNFMHKYVGERVYASVCFVCVEKEREREDILRFLWEI